ncbi:MAG: RNA polymerase sigma factor [Verrucomicrobiae bacterium]|nr:RNA polymerase sigma factor [Verrucomicrobiae bacterium]MCP5540731.1 RNA polymerase sigma factor [Akkermansiaceae bacterium]
MSDSPAPTYSADVSKYADDYDLVRRALDGDESAVTEFEKEYRGTLERVLMARGIDRVAAEDLAADIISECFGAGRKGETTRPLLEKFEGRSSLSTWLIRITWNRWLDLRRRDKFRGELPEYEDDAARGVDRFDRVAAEDDEDDFLETDLAELMAGAIREAFASLEPDVLVMLRLSYLHGISQTEIAAMWQCDQTRISRALSAARTQVAAETMRLLRAKDPELQIDWDDFKRLCAYGIEL